MHLGTGNYNNVTAKSYEDFGLFTADEDIAADVADLFNYLTGFGRPAHFRKLLVAPFTLRQRLIEEIRDVAEAARDGRKARIRIKVNGLTHTEVIDELYAASEAGARIDLLVRGICSLRPGVPGLSDGIRVRSVLGRFLEHSRVFHFESGDRSRFYMGSADLMPRNLDHRVEVVAPVEDIGAQSELAATIDSLLADTASSWELDHARRLASHPVPRRRIAHVPHRPCSCVARGVASRSRAPASAVQGALRRGTYDSSAMRIGVVDVGSNTIRLLVAEVEGDAVVPIDKERVRLSLGEEIERQRRGLRDEHRDRREERFGSSAPIARRQRRRVARRVPHRAGPAERERR